MGRKIESVLRGFTAQKCLTLLKLTTPRITISRNRRSVAVRQMRGEIAQLLKSGQATQIYDTKIETLIREENIVAAYDLLDHFCHSIISQFPVIESQRYCPPDLKEPIATLIYAAPRCVELVELNQVKDMLTTKYGKEFAVAVEEMQTECGVNRQIIEMLSMRPVSEQTKLKKMKEICVQHNIQWRPEWVPGGALVMPPRDFLDASSQARVDNRRAARDEGSIKSRPAEAASYSIKASNLVQDMKAHPLRGSRHGEGSSANMRVSESMNEPYRAASPRFGPKSNPLSREEVTRDSEGVNEPYRPPSPRFFQKGSSLSKEEVTRANTTVSESMCELYKPGFGTKHSSLPKKELPKANIKVSEGIDEPYRPSPGFGTKIPKEEIERANTRVSEDSNEPYKPAYVSKHSSLPKGSIKVSESMDELYKPGFSPKHSSIPREEVPRDKVPRANMRASEGIHEPNKPSAAAFGSSKAAEYKQEVHEDRAEYGTQHHDEISDSGGEVFVSVEEDEVTLSYKDEVPSSVTKNSFEGNHSSNSNLRARSLRASRETSLSREGSSLNASRDDSLNTKDFPYQNSFRANDPIEAHKNKRVEGRSFKVSKGNQSNEPRIVNNVPTIEKIVHKSASSSSDRSEEEDEFASTAKAIAAEAARLAVLDYARRYSRSGSISMDLGDLTEDASESMKEKAVYSKTKVSDYDDDRDRDSIRFKTDSTKEKYNRPSKTAANHDIYYQNHVEYEWDETDKEAEQLSYKASSNADGNPLEFVNQVHISKNEYPSLSVKKEKEELERSTQRRHGEKPQFKNERHHDLVDVNTRFDETSPPTYNLGKPRYDEQGKTTEGPIFDQVTYRQRQFSEESSKPYSAVSTSEKRPIFDEEPDSYFDSPHRNKYSQEMLDKRQQHRSSSKFKEDNTYNEHEPFLDEKAKNPSYPNQMSHDVGRRQIREPHGIHQQGYESEKTIGAKSAVRAADSQDLCGQVQLKKTNADPNASRGRFMSDRTAKSPTQFVHQQQMTQEDSNEDEHYAKDRNWNAAPAHDRENSMRARLQTDTDKRETTRAEGHAMSQRKVRSPVKRNKQKLEVVEQDKVIYESSSSKMIQQHSEKNILDDVLSAKWHGDDVSTVKATQHNKMENIQSSYRGKESTYNTPNKSQEPVTRNKLAEDTYKDKRTPSQLERHEIEPDLASMYTPHGQVDDLVKRVPSNSMSVRQQRRHEDVQVTASGYRPYLQQDNIGRKTTTLQNQEERGSPSKYNVGDQQYRQGKDQREQDLWREREQQQKHKEHQKSTTNMSPNHRHEPPTRKPPPLPQKNASISDRKQDQGQQHSLTQFQKKQEEERAYECNDSAMLDRRSHQPARPTPRANDKERGAKLDKEESRPPTRQTPSPLAKSISDPVISATKPPSSTSASASTKLASSISADPPAPMVPPKLPHVDDIAANLDALRQAKLARLRKPN